MLGVDRFAVDTRELPGTAGRKDGEHKSGLSGDALAAALAAVCAALDLEALPDTTAAGVRRMPVWKRAGLVELMRREAGMRDFA